MNLAYMLKDKLYDYIVNYLYNHEYSGDKVKRMYPQNDTLYEKVSKLMVPPTQITDRLYLGNAYNAIDKELLISLNQLALELGLHVLIETHNSAHLSWINDLNPQIVGINCRDLQNMKTDLTWLKTVVEELPIDCIKVAESGIRTNDDLSKINQYGYDAALVGTSLMKTGDPGNALAALLNRVPV